jgi:Domain of unknown function (DUF4198)
LPSSISPPGQLRSRRLGGSSGIKKTARNLFVGEDFVAEDEKAFDRTKIVRFQHLHGGAIDDALPSGRDGQTPMAKITLRGEGCHLLAMDRRPTNIELAAAKFESYLHHEGLEAVAGERGRLGESKKPGRERYSRYLKTLIQIGEAKDETYGAVTGAVLELVPVQNPVFIPAGGQLDVRVLFRGQPLPHARLEVFSRQGSDVRGVVVIADAEGRARLTIDRRGVWLLRMVHMIRCEGCADADWESFWSSYSFASSEGAGVVVAAPAMISPGGPPWTMILIAAAAAALATGGALWRRRALQQRPA